MVVSGSRPISGFLIHQIFIPRFRSESIEQWGSGLGRMISICEKQGIATPKFEELGNFFRTTLYHRVSRLIAAEHWQKSVIKYLKLHKGMQPKKAQEIWGVTARTTSSRLKPICLQGILVEISTGSFDPQKKFILRNQSATTS